MTKQANEITIKRNLETLYTILFCSSVYFIIALPMILSNYNNGNRAYFDHRQHLRAISHFAAGGTISDYPVSSAPGYYYMLSFIYNLAVGNETLLKFANSLISLLFLILIIVLLRPIFNGIKCLSLFPMIVSIYF